MENPGSRFDLVLKTGDIVYVPALNPVVEVKGSVQNQLKVFYDKDHKSVGYYIDQAGGFGARPWRKRIYVTYPNGTSRKTKNFGFFHFYPKVESGSVITIPERPQGKILPNIANQALVTSIPIFIAYILTRIK